MDTVIGQVFQHPVMGRTIVFESSFEMDDRIMVYELLEDGNWKTVLEKNVLDFFMELIPPNKTIKL